MLRNLALVLFGFLVTSSVFSSEDQKALSLDKMLESCSSWRDSNCQVDYEEKFESGDLSKDSKKEVVTLHHTVIGSKFTKNGRIPSDKNVEIVRETFRRHLDRDPPFADIGYHFLIAQSGEFFEGRPLEWVGAHTGGFNRTNIGIAFIGCFDDEGCDQKGYDRYNIAEVTDDMIASSARLIAFLSVKYGFDITAETVMARSAFDIKKKGKTKFLYSPGKKVTKKVPEIISKAKEVREVLKVKKSVD